MPDTAVLRTCALLLACSSGCANTPNTSETSTTPIVLDQPAECRGKLADANDLAALIEAGLVIATPGETETETETEQDLQAERLIMGLYGLRGSSPAIDTATAAAHETGRLRFEHAESLYNQGHYAEASASFVLAADGFTVPEDSPWADESKTMVEMSCRNAAISLLMADAPEAARALTERSPRAECRRGVEHVLDYGEPEPEPE